jgi:hypothetical protein
MVERIGDRLTDEVARNAEERENDERESSRLPNPVAIA